jgi:ubiquinone/menaquinone biosynthesis C-methylase UbiE
MKMQANHKNNSELEYWKKRFIVEGNTFQNSWYKKHMLNMVNVNESFFQNKVVADFGCGPRGSLDWLKNSKLNLGIDVNVGLYADSFKSAFLNKNMIFVQSTEYTIPLPDNYVDVLLSMNALDHVDNLSEMCLELLRILKPAGIFAAYFNLEEPASACEPQCLTEKLLNEVILSKLNIIEYKSAIVPEPPHTRYEALHNEGFQSYVAGKEGVLWVLATKK